MLKLILMEQGHFRFEKKSCGYVLSEAGRQGVYQTIEFFLEKWQPDFVFHNNTPHGAHAAKLIRDRFSDEALDITIRGEPRIAQGKIAKFLLNFSPDIAFPIFLADKKAIVAAMQGLCVTREDVEVTSSCAIILGSDVESWGEDVRGRMKILDVFNPQIKSRSLSPR